MAQLFFELGLFCSGLAKLFAGKNGLVRLAGFIYLFPLPFTFLFMMPKYAQTSRQGNADMMTCIVIDWGFLIVCGLIGFFLNLAGKDEPISKVDKSALPSGSKKIKATYRISHTKPASNPEPPIQLPEVTQKEDIRFLCRLCGQKFVAPADMAGNVVPCDNCGNHLVVPASH